MRENLKSTVAVSTHSRAEAAATYMITHNRYYVVSTHSRAEAAAPWIDPTKEAQAWFQHTAARRRLYLISCRLCVISGFNTQPPEGG